MMNKNLDYKVVYNLKIDKEKVKKRVITKILKLDENNQYGNEMTKPLPTGCTCYLAILLSFSSDISGKHLVFY